MPGREERLPLPGLGFQGISVYCAEKFCQWLQEHVTDIVPITADSREQGPVNLDRPAHRDPFLQASHHRPEFLVPPNTVDTN